MTTPATRRNLAAVFEAAAAPRLPLDEWAERFRYVAPPGPMPGQWRNRNSPMSIEVMRAVSNRAVSHISLMAPAQLMKSEFCINAALWAAAYGDPVLFWEPELGLLKKFIADRMRPALRGMLAGAIVESGYGDHKKRDSNTEIRFAGSGTIIGLTPGQKAGKSSYAAPMAIADEIDKMADTSMFTVMESRVTTYGADATIIAASTPTEDLPGTIYRLWSSGSRGVWHALCVHCGDLVGINWSRKVVTFDQDDEGFWLPHTAAMHCDGCGAVWTEAERLRAVRAGRYIHAEPEHPHQTFHVPGTAHLMKPIATMVAEGAEKFRGMVEDHDPGPYQLWVNERQGEVWSDEYRGLSSRRMERTTFDLGARGKDDLGQLDRRVVLITTGSDVHGRDIRTDFVAWGVDPKTGLTMAWGLQYRIIGGAPDDDIEDPELWRQFFTLLDASAWRHPAYSGRALTAHRCFVDAGYRPDMVRDELRKRMSRDMERAKIRSAHPLSARILPSIGQAQPRFDGFIDMMREGDISSPRQRRHWPAAVWLATDMIKDTLYEMKLRDGRLPDGAEAQVSWPLNPQAHGYTPGYFKEMANEVRDLKATPKGRLALKWDKRDGQERQNHAWDARVYATAAAIMHCRTGQAVGLHDGLLLRAIGQGGQTPGRWTDDEMTRLRRHLSVRGGEPGGDNVTRMR